MALIVPRRISEAPREVKRIDSGSVQGFQIGDEKILSWSGMGEKGDFSIAGSEKQTARLIIERPDNDRIKKTVVK